MGEGNLRGQDAQRQVHRRTGQSVHFLKVPNTRMQFWMEHEEHEEHLGMASLEFSGPNRLQLGITQLQNLARKSEQKKSMISEKVEIEENEKLCLLEPAPMAESARPSAATPYAACTG